MTLNDAAGGSIDVFPSLFSNHAQDTWWALWLTTEPVPGTGTNVELLPGAPYAANPTQKMRHRFIGR